jgi:hypothetical protein
MRRASILAALLMVAVAASAGAHEETVPADFATSMATSMGEISAAFARPEVQGDLEVLRNVAQELAEAHMSRLLAIVPGACYRASYAAFWMVYADLFHLANVSDVAGVNAVISQLDPDGKLATGLLTGSDC